MSINNTHKVFLVNNVTRLVLPNTGLSHSVLGVLVMQGHTVIRTSAVPEMVVRTRTNKELTLGDNLIRETGYAI